MCIICDPHPLQELIKLILYLPRFSWRAGLHRRRSVNAPLILLSILSFRVLSLLILHFTISGFHGLFTFFSHFILFPVCAPSLQRRHVFTLSSPPHLLPPQSSRNLTFGIFLPQQFSLDPSLAMVSSLFNSTSLFSTHHHSPPIQKPLATSEI